MRIQYCMGTLSTEALKIQLTRLQLTNFKMTDQCTGVCIQG